jgi:hypothetical protein
MFHFVFISPLTLHPDVTDILTAIIGTLTASVVQWSELLAAEPEVPGSITGATRFPAQQYVWNGVHSALVTINEELLERKVAAPV